MLMIDSGPIVFGVNCRHAYEMAWEGEVHVFIVNIFVYSQVPAQHTVLFLCAELSLIEMYCFELCTNAIL
jgi:hypothetical protein